MGWGYALLGYHPEVISRSFSAHLEVKLVKPREIFNFCTFKLFCSDRSTPIMSCIPFRSKIIFKLIIDDKVNL